MGDNAAIERSWHNTQVGVGYKAKHVIRQPGSERPTTAVPLRDKFLDLSMPPVVLDNVSGSAKIPISATLDSKSSDSKSKKTSSRKRERDHKEKGKKSGSRSDKHDNSKRKWSKKDDCYEEENDTNFIEFNPFLQYFATRISNKTMTFSESN